MKAVSKKSDEFIEWHTYLIAISVSGDGDELGMSFKYFDTMRQYVQIISTGRLSHATPLKTCVTIQIASHGQLDMTFFFKDGKTNQQRANVLLCKKDSGRLLYCTYILR